MLMLTVETESMIQKLLLVLAVFGRFFFFMNLDPDFPDRIRIFGPIRIQTQEKMSDSDPDKKTRIRNTGFNHSGIPVPTVCPPVYSTHGTSGSNEISMKEYNSGVLYLYRYLQLQHFLG